MTTLKSHKLFEIAGEIELENVEISICGKTEIKVTVFPHGQKMTGYIRNSHGGLILQAPLKKLDKILAETDMADFRERENSKQAIYRFTNLENLLTELDNNIA